MNELIIYRKYVKLFYAIKNHDFFSVWWLTRKSIFRKPLDLNFFPPIDFYNPLNLIRFYEDSTPLIFAIENSCSDIIIKRLIKKGADVNLCTKIRGISPLIAAIRDYRYDFVFLLINKGANVNHEGPNIPLVALCNNNWCDGLLSTVKKLVENGAEINSIESQCSNALLVATSKYHTEVVEYLLSMGAFINGQGKVGGTALMIDSDSRFHHSKTTELLLNHGANPNLLANDGKTALMCAIRNCSLKKVELLLKNGADPNLRNEGGPTALLTAISVWGRLSKGDSQESKDFEAIVFLLLDSGANVNQEGKVSKGNLRKGFFYTFPLIEALKYGFTKVATRLINDGAKVNILDKKNRSALYFAVAKGDMDLVKLLIAKKAKTNTKSIIDGLVSPLHLACINGRFDIAELLVSNKADVNSKDELGNSPLAFACLSGSYDIAELLINKNADVNSKGEDGDTPLIIACKKGFIDIVRLLIANGANLLEKNKFDITPLLAASMNGFIEITGFLLKSGASFSLNGSDYVKPLFFAVREENIKAVNLLIELGADINARNKKGNTIFDIAFFGFRELLKEKYSHLIN